MTDYIEIAKEVQRRYQEDNQAEGKNNLLDSAGAEQGAAGTLVSPADTLFDITPDRDVVVQTCDEPPFPIRKQEEESDSTEAYKGEDCSSIEETTNERFHAAAVAILNRANVRQSIAVDGIFTIYLTEENDTRGIRRAVEYLYGDTVRILHVDLGTRRSADDKNDIDDRAQPPAPTTPLTTETTKT